ncbi:MULTISPECIES: outer membrane protein transport protein [unclassified Pseudomonas]|uniref:outer membrane protein transport protein n=1 Tax=unclassified Pseudomonas TaxID=196821 RepID=UPI000876F3DE|nr:MULTISPECIES: outer membrane protein transport protein [unclassified Pseudomonas]SCZ54474.1 long-chain fatty acid transport protein [Pseudomonas sp. NFPP17]SDA43973.1 long-chain fatty acid transport protein [Pseudomonas sp. NFPP15]SEK31360.1 long-chain fatty acid transport protein [Pseudomonas sp. NFPP18]SFA43849.1 long-chain fatty acid transport protein [Pseudomonas sp. NFPP13]SFT46938.1 long-chain fatty acid transport protein [Pseudomonas sp. NFPP25]
MNNKKQQLQIAVALALLGGFGAIGTVQAGGFTTPTYGAPGWGRAFGGGSLFKNDPSAAYNNPAAMAFIDQNVAQMTVDYARIKMKYKGDAYDYQGNPATTLPVDASGVPTSGPVPLEGNGGQGGFTAWLPTGFMVMPINDQFAFGLSQVVPMGMRSTWDNDNSKIRDFSVDTKIETVGLTGSLSFKVNDDFSLGAGVIVQHSKGFVSQNLNLTGAAAVSPGLGGIPLPSGVGANLMRVKVDNTSVGWFTGVVWKPTDRDTLGLNYHAKIKNKMDGKYNVRADAVGRQYMTQPAGPNGESLVELAYPGLKLNPDGANASAQLDIPASAGLDWVHVFDDRFTLGASMLWTQWSSFKDLTLKSDGNTLVSIPYKYKDTMMYSLGGDYRFTDQLTLRAGVAYDQTPTRNSTRDPRIPDNDRWFTSLGFGYDIRAIPGLTIDGAYSRQFVKEAKIKTQNVDRLGASRLDGKADAKGEVVSLSATYHF